LNFDELFMQLAVKIPYFGKGLSKYYIGSPKFQRFTKFALTTFLVYWLAKAPLIVFFTDYLHVWYALSAFIVGIIITVVGFVLNESWIWKLKGGGDKKDARKKKM